MAGHSKWANIKHKKNANDAKRGKLYTKLIKEITVAVKEKGPDIASNARLKLAIQNAKGANVPKQTIEKAIKNSIGDKNSKNYQSIFYEGYGPMGVAFLIDCITDNINRTVSMLRSTFNKFHGSLAKIGSLNHLFKAMGVFTVKIYDVKDEEAFTLDLIENDIIDINRYQDTFYITCPKEKFGDIQKVLEKYDIEPTSANIEYEATNFIKIQEDKQETILKLINTLEDLDDVQKIYYNSTYAKS